MEKTRRPPICTVLGHVDCGKTSLLDRLRGTTVVQKEDGGITQRIGVTKITPSQLKRLAPKLDLKGLILVDTPGHECFTMQRCSGLSISDIMILVVDIFKGIQKQTVECIQMMHNLNKPYIVVANKVDRIQGWQTKTPPLLKGALKKQSKNSLSILESHLSRIKLQLAENGLNSEVYYKNDDMKNFVSIVPVSSKTGQGFPDMIRMIEILTNKYMAKRLSTNNDTVGKGFILEKSSNTVYGTIYTVLLTGGTMNSGDSFIGLDEQLEPVKTRVKLVLNVGDNSELKEIKQLNVSGSAETGSVIFVKLNDNFNLNLGSRCFGLIDGSDEQSVLDSLEKSQNRSKNSISSDLADNGVTLVGQTLGMVAALKKLCEQEKIPVARVVVGKPTKNDIISTNQTNKSYLSKVESLYRKRYNCLLVLGSLSQDKKVLDLYRKEKVIIFQDTVIYKLVDSYKNWISQQNANIREDFTNIVPHFKLKILPQHIFHKKNPLIFGVEVLEGSFKVGTVLEAVNDDNIIVLGPVMSIQRSNRNVEQAVTGDQICIKVENSVVEYGKYFDEGFSLCPHYTDEEQEFVSKYPDILIEPSTQHQKN